jgi:hypothetical protein
MREENDNTPHITNVCDQNVINIPQNGINVPPQPPPLIDSSFDFKLIDPSFNPINMEHDLTCSICFDILVKPSAISCGHMFCLHCIESYCNSGGTPKSCPTCRSKIDVNASFNTNKILNSFVTFLFKNDDKYIKRATEHSLLIEEAKQREIYLDSERYDNIAETVLDFICEESGYRKYNDIIEFVCPDKSNTNYLYEINYLLQYWITVDSLVWIDDWLIDIQCMDDFLEQQLSLTETGKLIAIFAYHSIEKNVRRNIIPLQPILAKYHKYLPNYLSDPTMERQVLYLPDVKAEIDKIISERKNGIIRKISPNNSSNDEEDAPNSSSNEEEEDGLNDASNEEDGSSGDINLPFAGIALFDCVSVRADVLGFKKGNIIEIMTSSNNDWYVGKYEGRTGLVAKDYIRRISSLQNL